MEPFGLNDEVTIRGNGLKGTVIGCWQSIDSRPKYQVRFYDSTGRLCEWWYAAEDLERVSSVAAAEV